MLNPMQMLLKVRISFVLIVVLLLTFVVSACAQQPESEPLPAGWSLWRSNEPSRGELECVTLSHTEWKVSAEGNNVEITEIKPQAAEEPKLPAQFKSKPEWIRARRHILRFDGGWLVGISAGEWGGGLWLTNEDGSQTKRILADNVTGILKAGPNIIVLSGLAHMSFDYGTAMMLSNPRQMSVSVEWVTRLDGAPQSFIQRKDGSVLVATSEGVSQITTSGEVQKLFWLHQPRGFYFWANSMAETASGTIYLGSRLIVLRFSPARVRNSETFSEYSQDWLLPAKCDYPCTCKQ